MSSQEMKVKLNLKPTSSIKPSQSFNFRKAAAARPVAEALRAQATARAQAAARQPVRQITQPAQPRPPARCAISDCSVTGWHAEKDFKPGDADLPPIIKTKNANWHRNVARGNIYNNDKIRTFLHDFHTNHGMHEDAFRALYPAPPEQCRVGSCPVDKPHPAKHYKEVDEDLPPIVKYYIDAKNKAWYAYDEGRYQAKRRWIKRFLEAHSVDKTVIGAETSTARKEEVSDEETKSGRN